jgi:Uma2 family endonuclease
MFITENKKYTAEDYMLLEEGAPFQLINYDLIMSPSPTPLHQIISLRLTLLFGNFLEGKSDLGFFACAPLDIKFDEGNVLQPDIVYISPERASEIVKEIIVGAPDLVIEILSPSTGYYDLSQKKDVYQKHGVKEYIVVDPIVQKVEQYILKNGVYVSHQITQKTDVFKSVLLPGLSFELSKIFRQ